MENKSHVPNHQPDTQEVPSGNDWLAVRELENGPVEIVDCPINSMVVFNSYVAVYKRRSW